MKGFIEVTDDYYANLFINIQNIVLIFPDGGIETIGFGIVRTKHSYEEIKQLIKEATEV